MRTVHTNVTHRLPLLVSFALVVAFLAAAFFFSPIFKVPMAVHAAGPIVPIMGYLWSDDFGWVDANCLNKGPCGTVANPPNFGLQVDTSNGAITGYAWSENVGWLSANPGELGSCSSGTCVATLTGAGMTGWMKFLSANQAQNGGWDGWVSLRGPGYYVSYDSGTQKFGGY